MASRADYSLRCWEWQGVAVTAWTPGQEGRSRRPARFSYGPMEPRRGSSFQADPADVLRFDGR
jgi:hypothetical protein